MPFVQKPNRRVPARQPGSFSLNRKENEPKETLSPAVGISVAVARFFGDRLPRSTGFRLRGSRLRTGVMAPAGYQAFFADRFYREAHQETCMSKKTSHVRQPERFERLSKQTDKCPKPKASFCPPGKRLLSGGNPKGKPPGRVFLHIFWQRGKKVRGRGPRPPDIELKVADSDSWNLQANRYKQNRRLSARHADILFLPGQEKDAKEGRPTSSVPWKFHGTSLTSPVRSGGRQNSLRSDIPGRIPGPPRFARRT